MSVQVTVALGDDGLVAVKTATTDDDIERLRAEAARIRHAGHPGLVALVGLDDGPSGAQMRTRYAGEPIDRWRGTVAQAAGLAAAVAATVGDLHEAGIVHGRLDETHVLLGSDGRPRLCGLAGLAGAGPADDVLAVGRLVAWLLDRVEPERRGPLPWQRGYSAHRRALAQVAGRVLDPVPGRRPSARGLAGSILAAVPDAELPPGTAPAPSAPEPTDDGPLWPDPPHALPWTVVDPFPPPAGLSPWHPPAPSDDWPPDDLWPADTRPEDGWPTTQPPPAATARHGDLGPADLSLAESTPPGGGRSDDGWPASRPRSETTAPDRDLEPADVPLPATTSPTDVSSGDRGPATPLPSEATARHGDLEPADIPLPATTSPTDVRSGDGWAAGHPASAATSPNAGGPAHDGISARRERSVWVDVAGTPRASVEPRAAIEGGTPAAGPAPEPGGRASDARPDHDAELAMRLARCPTATPSSWAAWSRWADAAGLTVDLGSWARRTVPHADLRSNAEATATRSSDADRSDEGEDDAHLTGEASAELAVLAVLAGRSDPTLDGAAAPSVRRDDEDERQARPRLVLVADADADHPAGRTPPIGRPAAGWSSGRARHPVVGLPAVPRRSSPNDDAARGREDAAARHPGPPADASGGEATDDRHEPVPPGAAASPDEGTQAGAGDPRRRSRKPRRAAGDGADRTGTDGPTSERPASARSDAEADETGTVLLDGWRDRKGRQAAVEPPRAGRRVRRTAVTAAAGTLGVALVAGGLLAVAPGGRPAGRDGGSAAGDREAPGGCPQVLPPAGDVDGDGCPDPLVVEGHVVSSGGDRWSLGEAGDVVAVGDWDCDGASSPAVLRPATGDVFVFPGWAGDDAPVTVAAVRTVPGAQALRPEPGADGCDALVVERADGRPTIVEEART